MNAQKSCWFVLVLCGDLRFYVLSQQRTPQIWSPLRAFYFVSPCDGCAAFNPIVTSPSSPSCTASLCWRQPSSSSCPGAPSSWLRPAASRVSSAACWEGAAHSWAHDEGEPILYLYCHQRLHVTLSSECNLASRLRYQLWKLKSHPGWISINTKSTLASF